jgi:hypothetical protein
VQLVNTEGLALIGPGSEWFWTAVSGLVLAITFLAIYRQLRLQRDALANQQLSDLMTEWSSERMARAKLAVFMAIQSGEELPDRARSHIGFFWQRVGFLVRTGHMDRGIFYEQLGDQVQVWWALMNPDRKASRVKAARPTGWHDFEWLAAMAVEVDADRGQTAAPDRGEILAELPGYIQHYRDAIELEEALRTTTVRFATSPLPVAVTRAHPTRTEPV